jgi:hypothetical protein
MEMPNIHVRFPSKERIIERCTNLESWKLPKQSSSIAPEHVWTNAGNFYDLLVALDMMLTLWQIKTLYHPNREPGAHGRSLDIGFLTL